MRTKQRVLLVQTPFSSLAEPSCGLGRLKASLLREDISCDCEYANLDLAAYLSEDVLQWTKNSTTENLFVELLYSSELFPDYLNKEEFLRTMRSIYHREIDKPRLFAKLYNEVHDFDRLLVARWKRDFPYTLVGISANYNLMPSLFMASIAKRLYPRIEVVLGGSECIGEVGHAIARTFPFLDWIVDGEGEKALVEIVRVVEKTTDGIPASTCRIKGDKCFLSSVEKRAINLDDLPFPNYDDYFYSESLKIVDQSIIPVEAARGCWWGRCSFCNEPCQSNDSYRRISDKRIIETMEYLAGRYMNLNFRFVDSVQPTKLSSLAATLIKSPYSYNFYLSLRADISDSQFESLVRAGMKYTLFGIESFSDDTLRRMNKGATVIDNISSLRTAKRFDVLTSFNIISPFPGETRSDIRRNYDILNSIPHLITGVVDQTPFFLKYRSPAYNNPARYGIKRLFPSPAYRLFLPRRYRFKPTFYWDYFPKARSKNIMPEPLLSGQREYSLNLLAGGNDFCVIRDRRSTGRDDSDYILTPPHSEVMKACNTPKRRVDLQCSDDVLMELIAEHLLIKSHDTYVSLTTRDRRRK